jgi:translation initiation factor 3 subunit H
MYSSAMNVFQGSCSFKFYRLIATLLFLLQIREEDDEADADGANYQLEMMRCLREVNVDNNTIGW